MNKIKIIRLLGGPIVAGYMALTMMFAYFFILMYQAHKLTLWWIVVFMAIFDWNIFTIIRFMLGEREALLEGDKLLKGEL